MNIPSFSIRRSASGTFTAIFTSPSAFLLILFLAAPGAYPQDINQRVDALIRELPGRPCLSGKDMPSKLGVLYLMDSIESQGMYDLADSGLLPIVKASGGPDPLYAVGTDYRPDRTLYPHARFVEDKEVWPTFSGRQQFLLDHPWYEEAGEALPVYKEPPQAGGDYPLRLCGGHTRWSIHGTWRDTELMLRLQRGEPAVWIAKQDAEQRGIADGDRIRVYNDVGEFEAVAKLAASIPPGAPLIYHAWEPYQFKNWKGPQEPVPSPWKALHLAGGYGQLHYRGIYLAPGHSPRAQAVEIVKAT